MPMRPSVAETVPSSPTSDGLGDLQAELGQVEWLGPILRARQLDALFADARDRHSWVWQRLLACTH